MKTSLAGPNAMNRIRVFLIATCIIAVTPRLSADIILLSRLSDEQVCAWGFENGYCPPPQSQTDYLPAHLHDSATGYWIIHFPPQVILCSSASSTSNSSIFMNSPMEGLRVVGDGAVSSWNGGCEANASAKLIVLSFTVTEVSYPYSMSGQLNGSFARAALPG